MNTKAQQAASWREKPKPDQRFCDPLSWGEGSAKWHHHGDRGAGNLMTGSAMLGKAPSLAMAI